MPPDNEENHGNGIWIPRNKFIDEESDDDSVVESDDGEDSAQEQAQAPSSGSDDVSESTEDEDGTNFAGIGRFGALAINDDDGSDKSDSADH